MTSTEYLLLPTQTQLVSRLRQLVGFSSSFIFLSGSKGTGKTSVAQLLLNELDANFRVGYVTLNEGVDLLRIREQIVLQFAPGAVFDSADLLGETLDRLVSDLSVPRVLIVDNADCHNPEWIFELWKWLIHVDQQHPNHKISILLIGASEFSEHLAQHLKGRAQAALEIDIEPLTLKEQKKLLVYCLQDGDVSAAQGEQALALLANSQGKPGEVVAIAEACMDKKSLLSSGKFDLPVNKIVAGVAVVAGVVLLLSWIIPSLSKKDATPVTGALPERQAIALAPNTSSAAVSTSVVSSAAVSSPVAIQQEGIVSGADTVGLDAEQPADDNNKHRVVISDQAIQQMSANQPVTGNVVATSSASGSAVTSLNQLKPIVNEIKTEDSSAVSSPKVEPKPKKKAVSHTTKPVIKHKVQKTTPPVTKKLVEPAVKVHKAEHTSVAAAGNGFALQLVASSNPAALKKLAMSNGLQTKTQVYKNQSSGMYVLIYGEYSSAKAAKAAIAGLPAALKNMKPWPKSYAQIHKEQGK
ncbi:SPOR domain-containing protein [Tolumonas lignilytica]|uniref:SPOR domain-containing protein n=1 Tax=Tolumonas lignilytica TaxID=1283284 RepID=UPI000463C44A|nr:AAA family ATPase [Tolumonas lignilytica]